MPDQPAKHIKRTLLAAALLATAMPAAAYVGPGAGLSLLGSLWGLIVAVVLIVGGLLLLPARLLLRRMRKRRETHAADTGNQFPKPQQPEGEATDARNGHSADNH